MTTASAAIAADLCPECGYDRRGGEAGRACPECGYQQPADEFVAWGRSRSETVGIWRRMVPVFFAYAIAFVLQKVLRNWLGYWDFLFFGGVALGAVGIAFWRQQMQPRPEGGGPQQLRLSPRGFAVRTGFGPVEFKPWKKRYRAHVRKSFGGDPEVVVEEPFVGPVVLERPLVFRPAPGEIDTVARRITTLLREASPPTAAASG